MMLPLIKRVRLEHGITEAQAAERLNISRRACRRLENGDRKRSPLIWPCQLAGLYHIDVDEFLRDAVEEMRQETS